MELVVFWVLKSDYTNEQAVSTTSLREKMEHHKSTSSILVTTWATGLLPCFFRKYLTAHQHMQLFMLCILKSYFTNEQAVSTTSLREKMKHHKSTSCILITTWATGLLLCLFIKYLTAHQHMELFMLCILKSYFTNEQAVSTTSLRGKMEHHNHHWGEELFVSLFTTFLTAYQHKKLLVF